MKEKLFIKDLLAIYLKILMSYNKISNNQFDQSNSNIQRLPKPKIPNLIGLSLVKPKRI